MAIHNRESFLLILFVLLGDVVRDGGGLALGKGGDAASKRVSRGHGWRTADWLGR